MFFGTFEERSELSFFLDGNQINGWRAQSRIDGSALDIRWAPTEKPLRHAVDMQAKTTVGAIFHLFNFCDFRGLIRDLPQNQRLTRHFAAIYTLVGRKNPALCGKKED